ncbi:hypothetical protein OHC33_007846 [Knufia fluminis]|uniref:F-box domain-containing protein n=1 Tax=Knufia fluminis TaxID=191047 RepID=A0AAN8EBK3_9EURO|nr:hypothetical protein OHC33_007846 [Knufia fluminis]
MANSGNVEPFQLGTIEESVSRFSLRSRKSSYTSSSKNGSSATNESVSNASGRPSIAESGRSRSSLASFSSRWRKDKKQSATAIPKRVSEERNTRLTLGQRFCDLPAEIQTSILAYLENDELLSLRLVSKQCLAILQANASTIARNALLPKPGDNEARSAYLLVDFYPSLFSSTTTDAYLLRSIRREALLRRQLHVLLRFIQTRTYMLKLTRNLQCEHFGPYRNGLYTRFYKPVGLIQHYLETIRHLVIHAHPDHLSPRLTIDHCPACMATLMTTIESYPTELLVPVYQTIQLLLQHFRTATRTPSSVTTFERKLRGWSYGPPPESHMAQFVLLGGIQELCRIDEMHGSYSKRLAKVKQYSDTLSEAVKINGIAFSDFYQTQTDPVMAMAGGPPAKGKQPAKIQRRDKADVRTAIEARADEKSVMQSLNVRLDLLTEQVVKSIPNLEAFLVGPKTLLGRKIMEEKLVEHERELLSPYGFVQRLMAESYEPESTAAGDEAEFDGGPGPS